VLPFVWDRSRGRTRAAAPSSNNVLVVGDTFGNKTLDPGRTGEFLSLEIDHAAYDTLVTFYGADLKTPRPSLATNWKVSEDGRTYTFILRPGVKFASGNPLTSADVKWSFDRFINLKGVNSAFFDAVAEVQAPDTGTVVIRLKQPQPSLIPILQVVFVLDSKLVMENGGDASPDATSKDRAEQFLNTKSAGSGPFMLASYTTGNEAVLVRNPNYWGPAAKLDRVIIHNVPESSVQGLQLRRGDIDIAMALNHSDAEALRSASGVVIRSFLTAVTFELVMNEDRDIGGPFANPKVQQAVRYALDYQGLLKIAGPGAVRVAGLVPLIIPGALDPREAMQMDRAKAKALLAQSGVGNVSGTLSYGNILRMGVQTELVAQKVQSDLAEVGMQINLDGEAYVTALTKYRSGKDQFGLWSYALSYADADQYLLFAPGLDMAKRVHWHPESAAAAKALNDLAMRAFAETNTTKRLMLYQQAARQLNEIGPFVPLFEPAIPLGYRSNVSGVTYNGVWGLDFYTIARS